MFTYPLTEACRRGDAQEVIALLEAGSSPDAYFDGQTPVSVAVQFRRPYILSLLLARGGHINSNLEDRDNDLSSPEDGMTPVGLAMSDPDMLIVLMAESGAYPDIARATADGTRFLNLVRREDLGKVFRSLALHNGGRAEKAVLKMRSEALIEADKIACAGTQRHAH